MNETESLFEMPVDAESFPLDQAAGQDPAETVLADQEATEEIILDDTETIEVSAGVLKQIEELLFEINEKPQDEVLEATEESLILDQESTDYTEQLRGIHVVLLLILLLLLFWWLYDRISNGIRNLNKWTK